MKRFILAIFIIYFASVSTAIAKQKTISEDFDFYTCRFTPYNTESPHTIEEDTIIDTNTESKSYSSYNVDGKNAKLMVKNMKLDTLPSVLEFGPLGERDGVLHTGRSIVMTKGISHYYHFAGIKYDLQYPATSLDIAFSYLNNRKSETGKVVIVLQDVDENENIIWETSWVCAGFASWAPGWRDIHLTADRWASRINGNSFNRVWIIEGEIFLDEVAGTGGYFDKIEITVEQPTAPEIEEPVAEAPPEEEDNSDDIHDAIATIEDMCPCDNDWKNHGQYVRCVAQEVESSLQFYYDDEVVGIAVSEAAKSNCGKKRKNERIAKNGGKRQGGRNRKKS